MNGVGNEVLNGCWNEDELVYGIVEGGNVNPRVETVDREHGS